MIVSRQIDFWSVLALVHRKQLRIVLWGIECFEQNRSSEFGVIHFLVSHLQRCDTLVSLVVLKNMHMQFSKAKISIMQHTMLQVCCWRLKSNPNVLHKMKHVVKYKILLCLLFSMHLQTFPFPIIWLTVNQKKKTSPKKDVFLILKVLLTDAIADRDVTIKLSHNSIQFTVLKS